MSAFLSVQSEIAIYAVAILSLLGYALLAGNGTCRRDAAAHSRRPVSF